MKFSLTVERVGSNAVSIVLWKPLDAAGIASVPFGRLFLDPANERYTITVPSGVSKRLASFLDALANINV